MCGICRSLKRTWNLLQPRAEERRDGHLQLNQMLKLIQKQRLPKGTSAAVKELRASNEFLLKHRDVIQIADDYRQQKEAKHLQLFLKYLPPSAHDIPAILLFRDVEKHSDDWPHIRYNQRYVAPAFVHLVIHGTAKLTVGNRTLQVRPGDVFAMDMNKPHSVDSRSLCITVCVTVPRCTV